MEKKIIHIFLSSDEADTHDLRMELGNYIRALNDRFENLYFRLWMNGVSEDSGARIGESDYVYTIVFRKVEADTVRDFHTAYDRFKVDGAPKIMTFFKTVPAGEAADESVKRFMTELGDRLEHYYTKFESIDSVMLKILLELAGRPENAIRDVKFQDSALRINEEEFPLIHLENLPFYEKHEAIQALKKKLEELEDQIEAIPLDPKLKKTRDMLCSQRAEAQKKLHDYEKQLLEVSMSMAKRAADGKPITRRARLAMEYFDAGKVTEALAVLDPEEFKLDLKRLDELGEVLTDRYEALVQELTTKIDILKSRGVTSESAKEIKDLYETAREIVWKRDLDLGVVVSYVSFLDDEHDYTRGVEIGEKLYHRFKSMEKVGDGQWARFCNTLAVLYSKTNRPTEAEELYGEALEIYRRLAEAHPEAYEPIVAGTCSNLANLYRITNRLPEAEKLYLEALEIRRRLAASHPEAYEPEDVATACNNLANLYYTTNRLPEAEELYLEALGIRRRLAASHPEAYEPVVARTCYNLATLYSKAYCLPEAEKLYLEALEIQHKLAEAHPEAYEPDVAMTCNNLAVLYSNTNRLPEAEELYGEALGIRRRLAASHPEVYEPDAARTCYNLAILYKELGQNKKSVSCYDEALRLALPYTDTNPCCRRIVEVLSK